MTPVSEVFSSILHRNPQGLKKIYINFLFKLHTDSGTALFPYYNITSIID